MSRDGTDEQYREADVPPETEVEWLRELTRAKLCLLSQAGNWTVVSYLNHHSDFGHLPEILRAEPKGVLWERCAFLENLIEYATRAGKAGCDPSLISEAAGKVVVEAERLLKRARSEKSIRRVQEVLEEAPGKKVRG